MNGEVSGWWFVEALVQSTCVENEATLSRLFLDKEDSKGPLLTIGNFELDHVSALELFQHYVSEWDQHTV